MKLILQRWSCIRDITAHARETGESDCWRTSGTSAKGNCRIGEA